MAVFTGTNNNDTINGGATDDLITGLAGSDSLSGGQGNDTIYGGIGGDTINGGLGNDTLDGGLNGIVGSGSTDYASYQTASGAVTVNLATGIATGADGTDSLVGFEGVFGSNFDDSITGGSGQDFLMGGLGNDTLNGGAHIDRVDYRFATASVTVNLAAGLTSGADGVDTLISIENIRGSNFNDALTGNSGDNVLRGGAGDDTLDGAAGNDTAEYNNATAAVTANLATGTSSGADGVDTLISIENLTGSTFNDTLTGDANANRIEGGDGSDTLAGGLGNDTLVGGDDVDNDFANYASAAGAVTVNLATGSATGADGNDTLIGMENVIGSAFSDTITGDDVPNNIRAGLGNDTLDGGGQSLSADPANFQGDRVDYSAATGAVTVNLLLGTATGADGTDTLSHFESARGSDFADSLTGDGGSNFLRGGLGNDTLDGGAGFDAADYNNASAAVAVNLSTGAVSGADGVDTLISIEGVSGSGFGDTLIGGAGDDKFWGRGGNDSIDGGVGFDIASYRTASGGVTVNLTTGQATGEGTDSLLNIEGVEGSFFNDTLTGNAAANQLDGSNGDDYIFVSLGADTIDGGAGYDFIDFALTGIGYGGAVGATVNLAAGTADADNSSAGALTTLAGIEGVTGTAGNDVFTGGDITHAPDSSGNNVTEAFRPRGGNDTITGATGNGFATRVDYATNSNVQAVTVNLGAGTASDGLGGTDTLVRVDQVYGGAGNDTLLGGSQERGNTGEFREEFRGNSGNDTIDGAGTDTIVGAAGIDRVNYSNSPSAVTVNLSTGTASDGFGFTDTLLNIDQVIGSAFNDTLTGGMVGSAVPSNHLLRGGAGDDLLVGINNGVVASYQDSTAGVVANLVTGRVIESDGIDTLTNIQDVRGSDFNDTMTGNDFENRFIGDAGADTIDGGGGIDFASYESARLANGGINAFIENGFGLVNDGWGSIDTLINIEGLVGTHAADTLRGGFGTQAFLGRGGNDVMDGGADIDIVSYLDDPAGVTINLLTGMATDGWGGVWGMGGTDTLISIEYVEGSAFADNITGDAGDNFIGGLLGNDTLNGGAGFDIVLYDFNSNAGGVTVNLATGTATGGEGNDTLSNFEGILGSDFADTLTGDGNANLLEGGLGNDTLDGGGGIDTAQYINAGAAVTVNLATGTSSGADGNDSLIRIENITGGAFGDTLIGDGNANRLEGGDGADTLTGGLGNDTLDGGNDGSNDVASYAGAGAVTVNLVLGTATGDGSDTLIDIENVFGSDFNDSITGDENANNILGGLGNDTLDGGGQSLALRSDDFMGDRVDYRFATGAVTVSLLAGTATGADGTDALSNFESVRGSNSADSLTGDAGNNFLRGGLGNDTLDGGAGIDAADYNNASAAVSVNLSTGVVAGTDGVDMLISIEGVSGSGFNDTLIGGAGNDWFWGRGGNDSITGGLGFDMASYRTAGGNVSVNLTTGTATGEGTDTLSGIEGVEGSFFNDTLTGSAGTVDNALYGLAGDDLLRQTLGADTLDGGTGSDRIDFTQTTIVYAGAVGVTVNLFTATSDADNSSAGAVAMLVSIESVTGTAGNDVFTGGDVTHATDAQGNSTTESFRPLGGDDTITGPTGNGFNVRVDYSTNTNAQSVSVNLGTGTASDGFGGTDTLVRVNQVFGGAGNDLLLGGSQERSSTGSFLELYRGNSGNDTINGAGTDTVVGAAGNDQVNYGNSPSGVNVNLATGIAADGFGFTDTLINIDRVEGSAFNDTLTGGGSSHQLTGGAGDDLLVGAVSGVEAAYTTSTAGVVVNLLTGKAIDALNGIDTLVNIDDVRGSDFADTLIGNAATNRLNGDAGADTIDGGAGLDFASYTAVPLANGGINAFIENGSGLVNDGYGTIDTLTNIEGLTGTQSGDTLTGGLGDQWFAGRGGNDIIDGGAGSDWVTYGSSPAGVTVDLLAGGATDDGWGGIWAVGGLDSFANIENVEGSNFADSITGDAGNNSLSGLAGNDLLDGGAGADTLIGGDGDDTYVIDNIGDVVTENPGGGIDTVQTSVAYALPVNVENITFIGSAALNITGNAMGNVITGNSGNNVLDGGGGNDTVSGGDGDDTVIAATSDGDDVLQGGNGFDTLDFSAVGGLINIDQLGGLVYGSTGNDILLDVFSYVIGTNFNDNLSGGNQGDVLDGNDGDDLFFGNKGDDLLRGGDGNDTFYFSVLDGDDRLLGGNGFDVLDYSGLGGVVQVNQFAGTTNGTAGNDTLLDLFEMVIGTSFGDVLSGGNGPNTLKGGPGDDQIFANGGDDYVNGGPGNDTTVFGPGNDTLDFWAGDQLETITDFHAGAGSEDTITLTHYSGIPTTLAGLQAANRITQVGADTHIALNGGDEVILQNVLATSLHQDDFVF